MDSHSTKKHSIVSLIGLASLFALIAPTDTFSQLVTIGYPLNYTTQSALFPGLGEAPQTSLVPRLGQTFVAPENFTLLNSFSFWLGDSPVFEPQPTVFEAVLMAYGTDRPTGPILYRSGARSTAGLLHGEVRRFDFTVGAMLDEGTKYVMFLDVSAYLDGIPSYTTFASQGMDVYSPGTLVHSTSTLPLSDVSSSPWSTTGNSGWDVVFRAEFAPTPIPETSSSAAAVALIATTIALRIHFRNRKRSSQGDQAAIC